MFHKTLVTTSRNPSRAVRSFCNRLAAILPNCSRLTRGKMSLEEVCVEARLKGFSRLIVVERWKGTPGKLRLVEVSKQGCRQVSPVIYVAGYRLGPKSPPKNEPLCVVVEGGGELRRLAESLSSFLGVPLASRPAKGFRSALFISEHPTRFASISHVSVPDWRELGFRIVVRHVIWEVGPPRRERYT